MAISKKMKKQIKGAYKSAGATTKRKQTWSLSIGDLVEVKSRSHDDTLSIGVVVKDNEDGYYMVMTKSGRKWHKAVKLRCIEKAETPDACK